MNTSRSLEEGYEELYGQGAELLRPLIVGSIPISQVDLIKGIDLIERALEIEPRSWAASWVLGRSYTIVGDMERSHRMFRLAYQLNPSDKNVGTLGTHHLRVLRLD
jgi:hypothetical protein